MLALSLIGESSFSVLGRKYAGRFHPFALFGATIAGGFAVLTALAWWQGALPIPGLFARLGWDSVLALLWLGPVGTTASYIFWMTALERAPVASVAITLLVQPVFGALWGAIFLGETFSAAKGAGAAFILSGLLVQALPRRRPRSSP
jgi:drug/metabolite transporter (DMT)-like permease